MDPLKLERAAGVETRGEPGSRSGDGGRKPSKRLRIAVALLAVAAAAGLGLWLWKAVLEDRLIPKRFGVVVPGKIYRSGQLSAALVRSTLVEHGIRAIVDLTGGLPGNADQLAEARAAEELGIDRHLFLLEGDATGDVESYAGALARVHEAVAAGKPVLIHCAAGTQRTGAAIAAYRILVEGWPRERVIDELESYEWDPEKDRVLLEYLDAHLPELARRLAERGVIDGARDTLPRLAR